MSPSQRRPGRRSHRAFLFCEADAGGRRGRLHEDGGELQISRHSRQRPVNDEPRVNERIRVPRVRLIGADGDQLGIFNTDDAQGIADDQGLDLVEVAPNSDPPVARIMDYGKYKYDQAMKAKRARKHQTTIHVKEIKFRPKIDDHDYETKKRHVVRFLESGAKVKVTIMFRGREMVHPERGLIILNRLEEDVRGLGVVETEPKLEGRNLHMMMAPVKQDKRKKEEEKAEPEPSEETAVDAPVDTAADAPVDTAADAPAEAAPANTTDSPAEAESDEE